MKINKEDCEITIDSKVGVSVLKMPSIYFSTDSSIEQRQVYHNYVKQLDAIEKGDSTTLIIPSDTDINGHPLFEFIQPNVVFQFPSITKVEVVGDVMVGKFEEMVDVAYE